MSVTASATARVLGHVFSATQIDTFLDCQRKWAWRRIARVHVPSGASAQVGDRCHHQLEDYLDGKPLDYTEVVNGVRIANVCASGVHLLPDPETARDAYVIERSFEYQSPKTGFVYVGRKDLCVADGAFFPKIEGEPDVPGGAPVVSDHKTTSSLSWAKTSEKLEWDVQSNLYGHEECERCDVECVDLVWTYYQTKGAKASKRVHLRVLREDAAEKFALIESVASDMALILDRVPRADSSPEPGIEGPPFIETWDQTLASFVQLLPPNPACCGKYGGCGFRHVCRLTPEESEFDFMSDSNTDDLFDSLKKRAAAQDAESGSKPTSGPPAAKVNVDDLFKDAKVDESRALVNPDGPQLPLETKDEAFGKAPESVPTDMPINPPESTLPPPPSAPASSTESAAPSETRRKPGRPKKEKPATVKDAIDRVDAEEKTEGRASTETLIELADTVSGYDLFIDCFPVGRSFTPAEKLFTRANELVVEHSKNTDEPVADYRFLMFGKGGGALTVATMKAVEEEMPERIVVNSACDEARHTLSALSAKARTVTRGLR